MSIDNVDEARDRIKAWLAEEGLFKEEVSAENFYFQLAAEYPAKSGRRLSVI